jgi:hypothetical protein
LSPGTPHHLLQQRRQPKPPRLSLTGADPVAIGLVQSFRRPSGNLTGIYVLVADVGPKHFADALGLRLQALTAHTAADIEAAFGIMVQQRADPFFAVRREQIVALAAATQYPRFMPSAGSPNAAG